MNKKIKRASSKTYNGIDFKSKLEVAIYTLLLKEGFDVKYENKKFVIWEGFHPSVPFYNKDRKTNLLKKENVKIRDITYTPDFTFWYKNTFIIIEAKGFENDVFPIKKKLFRKLLEDMYKVGALKPIYFEIFTIKQLKQAINIIKEL